jgi:hypothetical protein
MITSGTVSVSRSPSGMLFNFRIFVFEIGEPSTNIPPFRATGLLKLWIAEKILFPFLEANRFFASLEVMGSSPDMLL